MLPREAQDPRHRFEDRTRGNWKTDLQTSAAILFSLVIDHFCSFHIMCVRYTGFVRYFPWWIFDNLPTGNWLFAGSVSSVWTAQDLPDFKLIVTDWISTYGLHRLCKTFPLWYWCLFHKKKGFLQRGGLPKSRACYSEKSWVSKSSPEGQDTTTGKVTKVSKSIICSLGDVMC